MRYEEVIRLRKSNRLRVDTRMNANVLNLALVIEMVFDFNRLRRSLKIDRVGNPVEYTVIEAREEYICDMLLS